jgi:hypothetical protein
MPESWFDGEAPETHQEARCTEHGVIALGPVGLVRDMIQAHFVLEHHRVIITEGRDFTIMPAPLRCDLCGAVADPPWWTHVVDPPLFNQGDADGLWLVCDPCHAHVAAKDLSGLVAGAVASQQAQSAELSEDVIRAYTTPRFTAFLEGTDSGVRA